MDDWAVSRQPHLLDVFRAESSGNIRGAAWDQNRDAPGKWRGWWDVTDAQVVPNQPVCALSAGPENLQLFAIANDGGVQTFLWDQQISGAAWRGPHSIPGIKTHEAVTGVRRAPGRLDLFAIANGRVYTAAWDENIDSPGAWRGWWQIGGLEVHDPPVSLPLKKVGSGRISAVSRTPDSLDVFVFRSGAVQHAAWDQHVNGGRWQPWQQVCDPPNTGSAAGRPSAVALSSNRLDVFSITPVIQGIWEEGVNGGKWQGWFEQGTAWANAQPVKAVASGAASIEVFMYGQVNDAPDNSVCHGSYKRGPGKGTWSTWEQVPGDSSGWWSRLCAVSRKPGVVDIFTFSDTNMYNNSWSGGSWRGWATIARRLVLPGK